MSAGQRAAASWETVVHCVQLNESDGGMKCRCPVFMVFFKSQLLLFGRTWSLTQANVLVLFESPLETAV